MDGERIILLNNGCYLYLQFSDNDDLCEGCDACIDYTLYDSEKNAIDGGQMDYVSDECETYEDGVHEAINDVLYFIYDDQADTVFYRLTCLSLEDGFDE